MRFFRDFVSCCGRGSADSTKPLAPPPSRTLRRRKLHAPHWRPSLGPISEDTAPPQSDRASAASGGDVKTTGSPAAATAKVHRRIYSDHYDCGRVAIPAIMPAFSPTPFMF